MCKRFTCRLLSVLFLFTVCCGCKNKTGKSSVTEICVNPDSIEKNFPFCEKFQLEKILPIKRTSKGVIADVKRIYAVDSLLLLWDEESDVVWKLDRDGNVICKIGQKGHAKNEYVNLNDVFFDAKAHLVYLLDNTSHKILCHDTDGNLKEIIQTKEWALGFSVLGNTVWMDSYGQNKDNYLLLKTEKDEGELKEGMYQIINGPLPIMSEKCFTANNDGEVLFSSFYLYNLYEVNDQKISPIFHINIKGLTHEGYDLTSDDFVQFIKSDNYYGSIHDVFKLKEHLFFSFRKMEHGKIQKIYAYYNIATGETALYDYTIKHDKKILIPPTPIIRGIGDDEIYFTIDPTILSKDLIEKIHKTKGLEDISTDSSPIIVIYKLRNAGNDIKNDK